MVFLQRKIIICFFIFSCISNTTESDFRIAAFRATSNFFHALYGSVQPTYQFEVDHDIHDHAQIWSNLTFIQASGNSIPVGICTKIHILPISAGLKAVYHTHYYDAYAGAGIQYAWLKESNHNTVSNSLHRVGGIFKSGIKFFCSCYTLSLFIDYQIQKFKAHTFNSCKKIDASGAFFGGSIGVAF